ncbi:MAG TPA: hypothetical protein VGO60_17150 [Iamia sp.]|jgi:hypothetical protein|nr:hypothetical protein [Iamia sp.]
MNGTRRGRRLSAAIAGLAVVAAGLAASPSPAAAEPEDSDTLVFVPFHGQETAFFRWGVVTQQTLLTTAGAFAGDFSGDPGSDVFLYLPGPGADGILRITPDGRGITTSLDPTSVGGDYVPLVGDFDGNAIDDVFWYAPGGAADSIWLFQPDGSHTVRQAAVTGAYRTEVLDTDGDGRDDIVWYAAGAGADSIWIFGAGATHTVEQATINGDYTMGVGRFSDRPEGSPQEQLLFTNPGGADPIWTFDTAGNHTSTSHAIPPGQAVVVDIDGDGRDAIYSYQPGPGTEAFTDFSAAGVASPGRTAPQANGQFQTAVGDFDGDGNEDIAMAQGSKLILWHFRGEDSEEFLDFRWDVGVTDVGPLTVPTES